jgi:hypothetical protein
VRAVWPRRAGRRTNLALLVLLLAVFATGALAFGAGTPGPARLVVWAHGAVGLALVLLVPWKSVVARRGLRRPHPHGAGLALAVLVAVAVLSGLVHALGPYGALGGVTAMQLHLTAALLAAPLVVLHLVAHPQWPRRTDLSRRALLRGGFLGGSAVAAYAAVEGTAGVLGLPGADRRVTGSHERGTDDPGAMPVTQWLDDEVPWSDDSLAGRIRPVRLVHGPRTRDLDPARLPTDDTVRAVLDCTGGWWAAQDWAGVRLDRLLADALGTGAAGGADAGGEVAGPEGRSLLVVSATGYARRLPLSDARGLLLATRVAGRPLSAGHGGPVRLVAPGRRGFWWVKWVRHVEVSDRPWWWQPPFPLT